VFEPRPLIVSVTEGEAIVVYLAFVIVAVPKFDRGRMEAAEGASTTHSAEESWAVPEASVLKV
jgi:hypothetical protein